MEYEDIKVAALLSVPMCGWNPHYDQVQASLRPMKIPLRMCFGAYWHQVMQCLMEDCVEDGLDWILTLDYDSMFTAEHLDRLIGQFGANPRIDALAALQCKRSTDEVPLCTVGGKSGVEVTDQIVPVDTAHFGMTLIRVEALKAMPKPWFLGLPDENGSYRTLRRLDADIYFWHKWRRYGNTLFVDPMCSIGHLQPLVSEFDENLQPRHVHVNDWRASQRRHA